MSTPAEPTVPAICIGIVGCGNIFERYVRGIARFPGLRIVHVADVDPERAKLGAETAQAAAPAGTTVRHGSLADLLADPAAVIVVNITPPTVHAHVTEAALRAGKHVYVEKPITTDLGIARAQLELAAASGLTVGGAPDTFLGSAGQTARQVVDAGTIGDPVGATAFVTHSRAETWHPDPTFLFKPGGGPVLDLGPYYVTQLVNCLGPVAEVYGTARVGAPVRAVTAPGRLVDSIDVEVETHANAVLTFASGVLASMVLSFDIWDHNLPYLEIYGTRGTLSIPDPNAYDGDVKVRLHGAEDWTVVPPVLPVQGPADSFEHQMLRGPGVADLAAALHGAPHRATGGLALHVLEVLDAIGTSGKARTPAAMTTTCARPAAAAAVAAD
ncbi:Gfo/Idh/MocA family protein [Yinghuangia soli]|uniref:Gfo/Idh/MocA family oxidoreductase n=1 Tax=Yinghuangia soli TaxID=2908204 RepID=A0AA41PWX3_9ACTN|nr:Gfo/Idh/MocA family oxidoreductase [Yinghuangia soli]MCF2526047.1 Gfo/Idh/MocA family oxidoreductase [Yinghuangia soli]